MKLLVYVFWAARLRQRYLASRCRSCIFTSLRCKDVFRMTVKPYSALFFSGAPPVDEKSLPAICRPEGIWWFLGGGIEATGGGLVTGVICHRWKDTSVSAFLFLLQF